MVMNWTKDMDLNVGAQLKNYFASKTRNKFPFVTVSREYGCDGIKLADLLVKKLNEGNNDKQWFVLTREDLLEAGDGKFTKETLELLDKFGHSDFQSYIREAIFGMGNQVETVRTMAKLIRLFADRGRVVLLGGGAPVITANLENGVHVLYYAPLEWRVKNHAKRWSLNEAEARNKVVHSHGEREGFVKTYLGQDINNPHHYDLMLNNERLDADTAADLIAKAIRSR